jgi:hypothetical protein
MIHPQAGGGKQRQLGRPHGIVLRRRHADHCAAGRDRLSGHVAVVFRFRLLLLLLLLLLLKCSSL